MRKLYFWVKLILATWGCIVLVGSLTPACRCAIRQLQKVDELRRADSILVLGAGILSDGILNDKGIARIVSAIGMYRHFKMAPTLIFSGSPSEIEQMVKVGRDLDIPDQAIILERQGSLIEQALAIQRIIRQRKIGNVVLVTSPIHSFRAVLTLQKAGVSVISSPAYPILEISIFDVKPSEYVGECIDVADELPALAYYWWKGWL